MERFPEFIIEKDFVENDELWKDDDRESEFRMQTRGRRALDRMFGENGASETCTSPLHSQFDIADEIDISITSHSQFFRNLLAVLNHQPYPLATGEMIPVVVKATRVRKQGSDSGSSGEE
jgi:hypothetical protein